jgi:hypothetical protein
VVKCQCRELRSGVILASLPGPTRKRTPAVYRYHLTYRNPDQENAGCALLYEVEGGREGYQVALERAEDGALHWHCSCPDAIYRGELLPGHICKHVTALLALGRPVSDCSSN